MKKFKDLDWKISTILIVVFTVFGLLASDAEFFTGYFVVGAWQVISVLVHYYKGWFNEKGTQRYRYQLTIIIIFITAAVGFIIVPILFVLLLILLFAAPVMAVWYTHLCYKEVTEKMQRPLDLLK